jgi:hypothetical protein
MATKPLPTIATDQQGRPVKQDTFEVLFKNNAIMIDIQKIQLDVLTDILGVMKNIADNLVAGLRSFGVIYAESFLKSVDDERSNTTNKLAEAEKEREAKLGSDESKPESLLDSLKKLFEDYFGIFRTVFNVLKLILLPLVFGFIAGFREKFDLFTVALGVAIMYPIRTFKLIFNLMVRVFGFLLETLKSIGKLISKIGPVAKGFVEGITNFFRRMRIFFLRTLDLRALLKPITSLFSGGSGIFKGLAKVLGGIFRVFGKLFIPLTIVMAVYDGIMGAIEGFKEGGILGGIKGALVGIIDGLIGWLVGIGQWIISNLLELLGFDELAKSVEDFNFKEFVSNFMNLLIEAIESMFIILVKSIPGGSALLSALGFKIIPEKENEPLKNFDAARAAAVDAAIKDGKSEDEIQAIRDARNEEELRAATPADLGDKIKQAAPLASLAVVPNPVTTPLLVSAAIKRFMGAESKEMQAAEATNKADVPVPVLSPNKAEDIDKRTSDAVKAKQTAQQPATQDKQPPFLNFDLKQYHRTSVLPPAPVADSMRLGGRGTAAVPNMFNWKPQ